VNVEELAQQVYATAPPLAKMKGHPEYQGWTGALVRLSESPDLAPFREVLRGLAEDALVTSAPLREFLQKQASTVSVSLEANHRAIATAAEEVCAPAVFVLAYVSLLTWVAAAGDSLYEQDETGRPGRAWTVYPYEFAAAGFRLGAYDACLQLAEEAYDVLFASKHPDWGPIRHALNRYRRLAYDCSAAVERTVWDLADDLRVCCGARHPNLRAEFGALLFTLGLVPQSLLFQSGEPDTTLPGRRFMRDVVRSSLNRMRYDRLFQYVWLEFKNSEAIRIRDHEEIFAVINNVFDDPDDAAYRRLELFFGEEPGRLYAHALVAWFRGTLSAEEKDRIMLVTAWASESDYWRVSKSSLLRMFWLAMFLGRRVGLPPGFTGNELRLMREWMSLAGEIRRERALRPELPDLQTAWDLCLHEVLEEELGKMAEDVASRFNEAWDVLESFRSSALDYWLAVTPPAYPDAEIHAAGRRFRREQDRLSWTGRVDQLLFEEETRIESLRGAYLQILSPALPKHFQRHTGAPLYTAAEVSAYIQNRGKGPLLDPKTGRKQYAEIRQQLRAIYGKLANELPQYARKRTEAYATWPDVMSAATQHMRRTTTSVEV
jgi:hypothetical protein